MAKQKKIDLEHMTEKEKMKYEIADALKQRNDAEAITMVLYPNDDGAEGKKLRLKQQYFFTSASLQDMLRRFREEGGDPRRFAETHAIQLNDTHPTVAIPELIRLLSEGGELSFEEAFAVARDTFAYTNHTVLPEALETWDVTLFRLVLPHIYPVIKAIDDRLKKELPAAGLRGEEARRFPIIDGDTLHMARLAVYATHSTNGVARLHTEILKTSVLAHWYRLFPERFSNKTNGVTQRRWLALANPGLSSLITDTIGDGWITDLEQLSRLEPYARDGAAEHLRLPDLDDVREGIMASKIAAHAADIANGLPGARDRDNQMSDARHKLDWEEMFRLAIDPEKARRYYESTPPAERHTCSMCGKMCAVRTTNLILDGKKVEFCTEL